MEVNHKILPPTEEELDALFNGLANNPLPVALLSTVPKYADQFVCAQDEESNLPPLLSNLYRDEYRKLSSSDLEAKCKEVFTTLRITKCEALYLEHATKNQNGCLEWFEHRVGRITASTCYAATHTNVKCPSQSLIKQICSTQYNKVVMVPALEWGKNNEEVARKAYSKQQSDSHPGFNCSAMGLVINPKYPHLGASPDGRITCDCCGMGILEIKCPYKYRDCIPTDIDDPAFCIQRTPDGLMLNSNHQYYYQVQLQLVLCEVSYCDFVVWTPKGIVNIRIQPDEHFFKEINPKLDYFFQQCILPELLTQSLQNPQPCIAPLDPSLNLAQNAYPPPLSDVYCYCRQGEDERPMIACDNPNCPYQWFHFECVGLSKPPKTKFWYCPDCKPP